MRALLLDDDKLRGRAIRRKLEAEGYKVTWAQTYAEACNELSISADGDRFHFATLDYNLEERKTGLDVARYIVDMPITARPLRVEVHSSDDTGSDKMVGLLDKAGVWVFRKDFLP